MGWVSTAVNAASGWVDIYGQQEQMKRQEELHKYNARVAEQDAKDAEKEGRDLANRQRGENARLSAKQRTLYGSAGVVNNTGTPLAVQAQTAAQLEMAALDNEIAGQRAASQLRQEKQLHLLEADSAKRARRLSLVSSIMNKPQQAMGGGMNLGGMFGGGGKSGGGGASMQGSSLGGGLSSAFKGK